MKRASKHQSKWPIAHEKQTPSFMDAQKDRQAGRLTVFCVSTSLQTLGTCVGHLWVWRHKMHSKIYGQESLKGNWLDITSMILVIMSSTMIITIQEINKVDKQWKKMLTEQKFCPVGPHCWFLRCIHFPGTIPPACICCVLQCRGWRVLGS